MKLTLRIAAVFSLLAPAVACAVYAPIPEQEQGKALTYRLGASIYYDTNIFGSSDSIPRAPGAPDPVIDSWVYTVFAHVSYNSSVTDQTFVSAGYKITNDNVADRPARKNLTSHELSARFAHAFSSTSNIDVSDRYMISKNPQSLLSGQPLNTDQSFKMNEVNVRYVTAANEKTGLTFKFRNLSIAYDLASLAAQLDRMDTLAGLEVAFAMLPETKVVGEYRYLDVTYDVTGNLKDKQSHFLLAGIDHNPGQNLTLSARAGFEDRSRDGAGSITAPSLELSGRYTYGDGSFLAGGYSFAIEEPSDVNRFTDSKVSRFFVNLQHRLTGVMTASGSLTYEPQQLQGRATQRDLDENVLRLGLALSWVPTKNWVVTGSYDIDRVDSDDNIRDQERDRIGVSARFSF